VPIDLPEATTPPTRRTFLTRTVVGGTLAATALATGATALAGPAGAQGKPASKPGTLDDAAYADLAVPLETAAGLAYQAAIDGGKLDEETTQTVTGFQGHHQDVVDALTALLPEGADAPKADTTIAGTITRPLAKAADQDAVLTALADLEDRLAATHLWALGGITDLVTAKLAAQILASESQASVVLGRKAGVAFEKLTPATVSTDGALTGTD
jgi:hypothetical protein